ncbi:MAG TPA: acyltransferase [Steroidobacteraceae bacterium]|nr:acyltransferase [Steroidobacteraceae bacterium]
MSPTSAEPLSHIPALDWVRGIAILLVLVFHAATFTMNIGTVPLVGLDRLYYLVCGAGWCGVDLFFVLSGLLITRILLHAKTQEHYFRNFYARRVLRIFPLYYLVVAAYLALASVFHFPYGRTAAPWLLTYTSNIIVAFKPWFVIPLPLAHFWTLAIEEQFYLLWPLCVLLLSKRGLLLLSVAIFAVAFGMRLWFAGAHNMVGAFRFTLCRLDALALGGAAAVCLGSARGPLLRRLCGYLALFSGIALLAVSAWKQAFSPDDFVTATFGIGLLALFFASSLFLLVSRPGTSAIAGRTQAVLATFGRYAYGMYVFHQPLLTAIVRIKGAHPFPVIMGSQVPCQALFALLLIGATLLIAMCSFHLVEKRFLRLKALFEYDGPAAQAGS